MERELILDEKTIQSLQIKSRMRHGVENTVTVTGLGATGGSLFESFSAHNSSLSAAFGIYAAIAMGPYLGSKISDMRKLGKRKELRESLDAFHAVEHVTAAAFMPFLIESCLSHELIDEATVERWIANHDIRGYDTKHPSFAPLKMLQEKLFDEAKNAGVQRKKAFKNLSRKTKQFFLHAQSLAWNETQKSEFQNESKRRIREQVSTTLVTASIAIALSVGLHNPEVVGPLSLIDDAFNAGLAISPGILKLMELLQTDTPFNHVQRGQFNGIHPHEFHPNHMHQPNKHQVFGPPREQTKRLR